MPTLLSVNDEVPGALDLLALFVTAAALDYGPTFPGGGEGKEQCWCWQIDIILTGLSVRASR